MKYVGQFCASLELLVAVVILVYRLVGANSVSVCQCTVVVHVAAERTTVLLLVL